MEKPPENAGGSEPSAESTELKNLDAKREAVCNELKALDEEKWGLISGPTTDESLDRLLEIGRRETSLIDQLGEVEREIAAKQRLA